MVWAGNGGRVVLEGRGSACHHGCLVGKREAERRHNIQHGVEERLTLTRLPQHNC